MGRKRKNGQYPPYCYRHGNRWIYREYLGKGKLGTPQYLCPANAPVSSVWKAYEKLTAGANQHIRWLLNQYCDSTRAARLAESTLSGYRRMAEVICRRETSRGAVFGDATLDLVTRRSIQQYIDSYPSPVEANRHIQLLKAAWTWGQNRYDIPDNPCIGVELNPQTPRDRYIEDWEYAVVLKLALESDMGWMPPFMELAYLCRARKGEVLAYRREDILPNGLRLLRSKKSRGEVTTWTPRLKAAVAAAQAHNRDVLSPWLLHNGRGEPVSKRTVESGWKRIMAKAVEQGAELPADLNREAVNQGAPVAGNRVKLREKFPIHDLKAKGLSDATHHSAGHRSARMFDVYMRKLQEVEASG